MENNNISAGAILKRLGFGILNDIKDRSGYIGYLAPFAYILASATEVAAKAVEHRVALNSNIDLDSDTEKIVLPKIKMFYDNNYPMINFPVSFV